MKQKQKEPKDSLEAVENQFNDWNRALTGPNVPTILEQFHPLEETRKRLKQR